MTEIVPNFLQQTMLFGGLPNSQLQNLAAIAVPRTYEKGESVFQQGEPGTGFFIVQTGRIKVFKLAKDGREQILHIFSEGDHFAEVPVLDGKPYPASATAIGTTDALFFPRQPFLYLLEQQPDLAINLLRSFARHLRHFSNLIDNLTLREVPARLANYLLEQSQQSDSATIISLALTKGQLAAKLGTIPETLSRAFAKLKQQGLLTVQGNQIQLLDFEALQVLADPTHN
jgi:CRP/FNR family transcriptional regulator